ncbi:hypothetical protein Hanom_Chr12g01115701 [Helianthus anomalus]
MVGSLYLLKMVSIYAITSSDNGLLVVKKASISSFSCSKDVAPMIVLVINGRSLTRRKVGTDIWFVLQRSKCGKKIFGIRSFPRFMLQATRSEIKNNGCFFG